MAIEGICSFITNKGTNFEGYCKNGLGDGIARQSYLGGSAYIGEWKNDMCNGKGIFTLEDGDVFKGLFLKNDFKIARDFDEAFLL